MHLSLPDCHPRDQLGELASLFCKIFDPDMSPLGFELDEMYGFVTARMSCREPVDQWQVEGWVHYSKVHSQLLNIIILKFNSPILLNQLGNIFPYRSSSTGSVLENILPVELGVHFPVHSQ